MRLSFAAQPFLREHRVVNSSKTLADSVPVAAQRGNILLRKVPAVLAPWRRGPSSLTNLNAYAFGLSAVFTGVGSGVMPLMITGLTDRGRIHFLWMDMDKNGGIAIVSLAGLIIAALIQPVAGYLSDRSNTTPGQRTQFLAVGAVGLGLAVLSLGFADVFLAMLAATIAIQVFGNIIQGPAQALLIDHVPPSRMGSAAGLLNVFKVAGAGIAVVAVLLLMNNYQIRLRNGDVEAARVWLWTSLVLVLIVMLISVGWTSLSLRHRRAGGALPAFAQDERDLPSRTVSDAAAPSGPKPTTLRGEYLWFLVSLVFVVGAMSAMQVYSIPFLEDAVGLENPALDAALLAIVLTVTAGAVAVPAGRLQDRFGHRVLLLIAAGFGAAGALLLLSASALAHVLLIGVPLGIAIGIFLSVTWAMANGLVPRTKAAQNLGYTSLATLLGAVLGRLGGPGIDALNANTPKLGYDVMLGIVALAFIISPLLLTRVGAGPGGRKGARQGRAVPEGDS